MPNTILIGLAGQSCAGKNTAAEILEKYGMICIDADKISAEIFNKNQTEIFDLFKDETRQEHINILSCDSGIDKNNIQIDKKKFSFFVFSNKKRLQKHEEFILPKIEEAISIEIKKHELHRPGVPIVLNAPTLHKVSFAKMCRFILYIKAPKIIRILRAKKRDKIGMKNILARFSKQNDFLAQYFCLNTDIVIVNNFGRIAKFEKLILTEVRKRGF